MRAGSKLYHPMTQGKIENYYLPGQFEARLVAFIDYYNSRRYHESLKNLTPADVYFGRSQTMPAAPPVCTFNFNSDGPDPILIPLLPCPKGSDDVHIRLARLLQALTTISQTAAWLLHVYQP